MKQKNTYCRYKPPSHIFAINHVQQIIITTINNTNNNNRNKKYIDDNILIFFRTKYLKHVNIIIMAKYIPNRKIHNNNK